MKPLLNFLRFTQLSPVILTLVLVCLGCQGSTSEAIVDAQLGDNTTSDVWLSDSQTTFDAGTLADATRPNVEPPEETASAFLVGYAERDITPALGAIMGGFGGPGDARRATGVNDPLMAQALLFTNDANQSMLLISIDVSGMFFEFGDWGPGIREARSAITVALQDRIQLEPHQIVITSSHTHAGTDLGGLNQDIGMGVDLDLLYETQWHLIQVALAASEAIAPANLSFSTSELNGWTRRDQDCSPVLDNQIKSVIVEWPDTGFEPLHLINFANHPTVLGGNNTDLSADFVWGLRTAAMNDGNRAMFIQGFIAAVHGRYALATSSGFERALEYGQVLYDAAMAGTVTPNTDNFKIESRELIIECTARDSFLARVFRYLNMPKRTVLDRDDTLFVESIPVSWHRIGDAEFIVWPGEPSPEYALQLKALMASPHKFAIGLGNDSVGYIVEPESLAQDTSGRLTGYEIMMGLGVDAGPCLFDASESLGWFVTDSTERPDE